MRPQKRLWDPTSSAARKQVSDPWDASGLQTSSSQTTHCLYFTHARNWSKDRLNDFMSHTESCQNWICRLITTLLGKCICSTPVHIMFLDPQDKNDSPLLHLHPRAVPGVVFTGCLHQSALFPRKWMEVCRLPFRILSPYLKKKRR